MIIELGFKKNINLKNYTFKRDIDWLLDIYDNGEKIANFKAKEAQETLQKITYEFGSKSHLTNEKEKAFQDFVHYTIHSKFLLLHSLFISAYSILEDHLIKIAKQLEMYSNYKITIKDISKDKGDLDRIRKYLNIVHSIEAAKSENINWLLITKFQKIRNLIVHHGNKLKDDNKEILSDFLKRYNTSISEDYTFHITSRSFLADFNNVTSAYSDRIVNEIYKIKHFNW